MQKKGNERGDFTTPIFVGATERTLSISFPFPLSLDLEAAVEWSSSPSNLADFLGGLEDPDSKVVRAMRLSFTVVFKPGLKRENAPQDDAGNFSRLMISISVELIVVNLEERVQDYYSGVAK